MSLNLTLFQIEDGLRDLYAMREEACSALAVCIDANGPGEPSELQTQLSLIDQAIRDYIGAELRKVDGTADFILMLDRLCHEQRERKGSVERCQIDQEIDRLKARRDSLRGVLAHVKDAVKFVMEGMSWREGKPKKLEGVRHSITLRGNGGAQPVEITDESLVPDEYCISTCVFPLDELNAFAAVANSNPETKLAWSRLLFKQRSGKREVSRSAIAEALAKPCGECGGNGLSTDPEPDGVVKCDACGGSGTAGVPGCRLAERSSSVIVK